MNPLFPACHLWFQHIVMVLENLPQGKSIHGHVCDPRISYFISLCIDSPWSLVKGLFEGHALAWLYFPPCDVFPPPFSVTFNFPPSCHRSVLFNPSVTFNHPSISPIGPIQRSTNNLLSIKHPFNSPSFTPSVLPSIPQPFDHPSVMRNSFPCSLHPRIAW